MAKYTIRDIARMANVSRSTVSLVLNNNASVHAATRQRVLDVIRQVNYSPSAQARGLVNRRAGSLALIVPESDEVFRNFYMADTIGGILEVITPHNFKLVIEPATRAFISDRAYNTLFQEQRVDGALIVGARTNADYVFRMRDAGYKICLVNSAVDGVTSFVADNVEGARMVARHLAALGHKDIAYIQGPDNLASGRDRHVGFLEGMGQLDLELPAERCAFGNFTEYSGYEAMDKLLRHCPSPPTALFAANDMMALGAIYRLRKAGLSVPGDMAVVGADDVLLASYASPPLTTIRQSLATIGRLAAQALLEMIDQTSWTPEETRIPASLIIRESCGAQSRPT